MTDLDTDVPRATRDLRAPEDEVPLLPLVLLVLAAAVAATALAAWGEAGGPDRGTLEGAAYLAAAWIGWPVVAAGPGALAGVLARRHGRTMSGAARWVAAWSVMAWSCVGFGLVAAFLATCDGACLG